MSAEIKFDESWYLATNPDVAKGVLKGSVDSAFTHYQRHGRQEKRHAVPPPGTYRRIYSYGSYGSNNVGDEAILDGVRLYYPEVVQLFHNRPRDGKPALQYREALQSEGTFGPKDYLIIGGGGLLYDRPTVKLMLSLARKAISAGAMVDLLRVGCEAAHPDYYDLVRELFAIVRFASVRSRISQDIIYQITGKRPSFQRDFALELQPRVLRATGSGGKIPTFGLALSSSSQSDLEHVAAALKPHMSTKSARPANFILVPHSRSYFDRSNNDNITAELLFTALYKKGANMDFYSRALFTADPMTALQSYQKLDGMISSRYHGLVFSQLVDIPVVAMFRNLKKTSSIIDDNPAPGRFIADDIVSLSAALEKLYDFVAGRESFQLRRGQ